MRQTITRTCTSVYILTNILSHEHTITHPHTHATHTHSHAHPHTHPKTNTHTHTNTLTNRHAHKHAHTHSYTRTFTHSYLTVNNGGSLGRIFDCLNGFRASLKRYRSSLKSSFSVLKVCERHKRSGMKR